LFEFNLGLHKTDVPRSSNAIRQDGEANLRVGQPVWSVSTVRESVTLKPTRTSILRVGYDACGEDATEEHPIALMLIVVPCASAPRANPEPHLARSGNGAAAKGALGSQ